MSLKINLGEDVIDNAKFVACKVDDNYLRKRVYALGIAANATAKYLTENELKTHCNHSLYKSAVFAKEIEIADIYANNARFDVRVTFNNTTFTVPKTHVKYDIKPEAYIVVKFDNSLKEIEFLGFIPENELEYDKNGDEYYTYPLDILKPFEDFISYAQALKITPKKYTQEEHDNILSLCAAIIDEEATEADKIYFIKHVVQCSSCRDTFCDINDFDDIVSQLKNYHELLNDSTLSVLSGNKEEVDQAAIANMALVENASEDFPEETSKISGITPPVQEAVVAGTAAGAIAAIGAGLASEEADAISVEELEPAVLNLYDEPESLQQDRGDVQNDSQSDDNVTKDASDEFLLEEVEETADSNLFENDTLKETQETEEKSLNNENSMIIDQSDEDSLLLGEDDSLILDFSEENDKTAEEEHKDISEKTAAEETISGDFLLQEEENVPESTSLQELAANDSFDELNASIDAFASEPLTNESLELSTEEDTDNTLAVEEQAPSESDNEQGLDISLAEDDMLLDDNNLDESSDEISLDNDADMELLSETVEDTSIDKKDTLLDTSAEVETENEINLEATVEDAQVEALQENTAEPELSLNLDDENTENDFKSLEEFDALGEIEGLEEISEEPVLEESNQQVPTAEAANDNIVSDEEDLLPEDNAELPELQSSDSLEIEDLETLDAIELPDEINDATAKDENDIASFAQSGLQIQEDDDEFGVNFSDENTDDVWSASSQPQEPVELKYDDEDNLTDLETNESEQLAQNTPAENLEQDVFDLNKQEPVIESFEEEQEQHVADFDFPDYNYENMAAGTTAAVDQPDISEEEKLQVMSEQQDSEQQTENSQNSEDEDLQGLLDDDLLALLSDEEESTDSSAKNIEETEEPYVAEADDTEIQDQTDENTENGEIENLFDEQEAPQDGEQVELDLSQEPMSAEAVKKTKKLAIAGALITLLAIGGVAGGYYMYQKNIAANNDTVDTAQDNQVFDFQNNAAQGGEEDTSSAAVSQDINKSMTNSFSDKPAAISITKLSWQVSEKLAVEPSVKEYLQTAGKNIQLNLQNDLANAADIAFNNSVKVSFEIAPDNTMKGIQILESSGSDKIDSIITKSIRNTLKYVSVPKLQNYNTDYFLTLIINF